MKELYEQVNGFWQKVIDDLIQSLKDVDRYASGNTAQAIGAFNVTPVTLISNGFEITIAMPDYYKFIDEGVSGAVNNKGISQYKYTNKMPPIKAIRAFMLNRGIVGSNYRNLRNKPKGNARSKSINDELNSVAFAIAYSIWRDGIKKTNFYSDVVNDNLLSNFAEQITSEYGRLIIKKITI